MSGFGEERMFVRIAFGAALGIMMFAASIDFAAAANVKCYGIAEAGQNDGPREGMLTRDYDAEYFKYTRSTQECIRMGGLLKPVKGRNPNFPKR
jgi:uncharacterized membrane protein